MIVSVLAACIKTQTHFLIRQMFLISFWLKMVIVFMCAFNWWQTGLLGFEFCLPIDIIILFS